ncbi:Hypothetical predicted protein [Paramuricea clavata]|uniref:Reverse transcriptase domain-containing protein n=1 Tax=Paramuricea clavata TaxID=317549 RepID=A0A7D9IV10_PARCT|nr:Hypothetical predicted protein [Paramuricea clavata]
MDSFNEDLKVLDLNDDYDLSVLIDKYENTLKETLQQHAPQKRRIITLRPLSPWYNEEIGQEKRNRRKLERRWRASGLCIDRQLYVKQCETVNAMIKNAKTTYYSSVISSNAHNQKVLFSTVDKLLHRKPEKRYPTASSTTELRNQEEQYAQCVKFINFQEVTEHEIENVIDKVGKKSCELDPVPAKIFQGCQKTLLPIITKISNESLQSGCMPEILKEAVLKPKLKKDSLDYEEYTNFRPISNLKFLSKVIEKVAAGQLLEHLANNKLEEPFQSAYKRFHSAETTLLKVQNDILVAIDNRKCVVLLLLDMSAAFDTVDHELLLQRMFKRFGIDGQVLRWFQSYLQNRTQSVVIDADEDSESVHEAEGPDVSRNEYLHEGGWQNVDNPLHELEFVQNEMHSFHLDQEHLEHRQCTMCKEAWPTRQNLASEVYICYRCKRDKKSPKKFSAENDMDPGTVPA